MGKESIRASYDPLDILCKVDQIVNSLTYIIIDKISFYQSTNIIVWRNQSILVEAEYKFCPFWED